MTYFNFDAVRAAPVTREPFSFFLAEGALTQEQAAEVRADYPDIRKPGYLPLTQFKAEGAFARLIEDLQSPELAQVLTDKFGVDFTQKPRMITIRRLSQLSDGPIHNDSKSKILTMLVYLNESWDGTSAGCIRALNGPDSMDDYVVEAAPLAGNVFAFLRSENSWHGHLPFKGVRYVIQTTFLINEAELARKEKRGKMQLFLKRLNPFQ